MNFIKKFYKRIIQAEIDSYKDSEDKDGDTIDITEVQDKLMPDGIST